MVEAGVLDPEAMAKIAQGQDGEFIEIELSPGQDLRVQPSPRCPTVQYLLSSRCTSGRSTTTSLGVLSWHRSPGEATKATATEITALAAYSASEIGRMARERDAAISHVASAMQ
jgi:hypothetical protein